MSDDTTAHDLDSATSTSVAERPADHLEGSTVNSVSSQSNHRHPPASSVRSRRAQSLDEQTLDHRRLRLRARELHHRERRSRPRGQRPQGHRAEAHRHPRGGGHRRQVRRHAAARRSAGPRRQAPSSSPATKSTSCGTRARRRKATSTSPTRRRSGCAPGTRSRRRTTRRSRSRQSVVERIKGGLTVDILGAQAFLPGSQTDLRPVRNLDVLKGDVIEVAVIKLNKKRGNIVVSRKQLLEEEQNEKKSKTLEHLEEGASPDRSGEEPDRVRRFCGPGRNRRPAAHHRYVLGTPYPSPRPGERRRPDPGEGAEVRQRQAAGFAGIQAAHARPLAGCDPSLSRGRARWRTRHQRHRLRRVRRAGAGNRRPGARQRDDLVQAHEASFEAGQCWRSGGLRGAERQSAGAPYFAGHAAAGDQSLGCAA